MLRIIAIGEADKSKNQQLNDFSFNNSVVETCERWTFNKIIRQMSNGCSFLHHV